MPNTLFIEHGSILDGTGAPPVAASLLIADGKVAAIGPEAELRAGQDGKVARYDARGCTVMPGLIDTHCHLGFDDAGSNVELFTHRRNALSALVASYNARKLLRAGVTAILDPDSLFENMLDLRDAIEAGIVQGPRMSCGAYALMTAVGGTAGRLIADQGITGYGRVVNSRDELVSEVRRQIKYGADWIKVHVTGIVPRQAHKGELSVWSFDELKLICETAHDLGTPVMGHCRGAKATRDAARADSLMRAHAAGVPLLCGSESGFSMVPYGHWHYREMEVFVRYLGMTPLEAIRCGTSAGAIGLRMQGEIGALLPGYQADLICVAGDPSRDVTILGEPDRIRMVMIAGREMDISPPPRRRKLAGWTVAAMGGQLTRDVAFSNARRAMEPVEVQELH